MGWFSKTIVAGYNGPVTYKVNSGDTKGYTVHIYKVTSERVGLALYPGTGTGARLDLSSSSLLPPGRTESSARAKTNCGFFGTSSPYNNYQGVWYLNGKLYYMTGAEVNVSTLSYYFDSDKKHFPCVCASNAGETTIRWFTSLNQFKQELSSFTYIFSAGHALVYNGTVVFGSKEACDGMKIAPSSPSTDDPNCRHNIQIDTPGLVSMRTMFGVDGSKNKYLVCTGMNGQMDTKIGAGLMKTLGCTQAVNLDGGGSTRMIVKESGQWKVKTDNDQTRQFCTALVVYS